MPFALHPPVVAAVALALALGGCEKLEPARPADEARNAARERVLARKLQAACSSPATFDRLKQVAFEEAVRIRNADPANLDTLATYSTVRMENPVVKSRDEALDVTVCAGRFVLDLPVGAERGFGGVRRLSADVEYAAQMAADGSGLVYQIKGAEPIIYKLAAFDLRHSTYSTPKVRSGALADNAVAVPTASATAGARPPETAPVPAAVSRQVRAQVSRPSTVAQPRVVAAPTPRAASSNPSFDCRKAGARSERMVCASSRLAALDRAMSLQFYSALSTADNGTRAELRRSRDRFLAFRNRCPNEECVAQAYQDRMAEIRDIAAGP
ncbi:lysozyme inhibitor LprI family protein [Novosphingobium sp. Gsoil 351]|uniref:lysozyme inhibitor LprI family protein n=1 Tax=Novosphingobium sp. Gsoil 351 TaxID=2675225 RepID=UPI0012B4EC10|nr:hypothetical protein [Novosphingobium sp. Gsoil 351]QGN55767.1 hypothetical protein GKE62_15635 [Novosphingobium sp. Gsoil 351]